MSSTISNFEPVKFATKDQVENDFFLTLRKRVNQYFKTNNLSKNGDYRMAIKVVAMPLMYFIPYFFIVLGWYPNIYAFYGLWLMMGIGIGGCGLGIMHDANHGSLSANPKLNDFIGKILNVIGGSALNWKIQHNVLHHSFTNVHGYDEDITPRGGIVRFSPHEPVKPWHKYQYIYAWFLYGLMTIMWITVKDFMQLKRYHKLGLVESQGKNFNAEFIKLFFYKIAYYAYALVIPLLVVDFAWYYVVLGFFLMHFSAGLLLGLVFQPAHVVETSKYPMPDKDLNVEANWAVHQLATTADFAPNNALLNWYVGGLNFQIEHHLFPNICHIHYPKIAKIVQETAKEYGFDYHVQPTFIGAIINHGKMLKALGKQ
jgi:linoleoyl-CoA desaturase